MTRMVKAYATALAALVATVVAVGVGPTGARAEQASQPDAVAAGWVDAGKYHSCAVMAAAVWLVAYRVGSNDDSTGAILRTGVGVVVGAVVFVGMVLAVRAEEVSALRARLTRRAA